MSLALILSSCLSLYKHHGKRQVVLKVVYLLFLTPFGVIQTPYILLALMAYLWGRIFLSSSMALENNNTQCLLIFM